MNYGKTSLFFSRASMTLQLMQVALLEFKVFLTIIILKALVRKGMHSLWRSS